MLGGPAAAVAANPAPQPVASTPAATPAPAPVARQMIIPPTVTVEVDRTYRQTGSANAPIRIEIYLDYDCPHCATFVHDVLPALNAAYVQTGKVALRYRDFPLPTHRFALLAARYANAAGELGFYDVAMRQILDTRQAWDTTGDIETQLAAVLTPDTMKNLRERLNDPFAADSIAEDKTSGEADHLDRIPFAVIVHNGVRQPIAEAPLSFEAMKNRIDAILEQK
jgi:protein-disulfide isomerase